MPLNKQKLIEHIKDEEQIIVLRKILDKLERVLDYHSIEFTNFLDPYQRRLSNSFLNRIIDANYYEEGGYNEAERKSIIIYPQYISKGDIDNPISCIRIDGNFKFSNVKHKDYLGAIMSLGINRNKIGDIIVHDNYCDIIVLNEIKDYILMNLNKINNVSVNLKSISFDKIRNSVIETKEIYTTVSSLRIDSILSSAFNISRSESSNLVKSKKVKVNFEPISRVDKVLDEKDLVSVRGKGRLILHNVLGVSNKGRIKLLIKTYR